MSVEIELKSVLFEDQEGHNCLLCGSTNCSVKIPQESQEKWAQDFCKLYQIQRDLTLTTSLDPFSEQVQLQQVIQNGFYCSNCMSDLKSITGFYKAIEDIYSQLRVVQLQCELKLRSCLQSVEKQKEQNILSDEEAVREVDYFQCEIQKQLLKCMSASTSVTSLYTTNYNNSSNFVATTTTTSPFLSQNHCNPEQFFENDDGWENVDDDAHHHSPENGNSGIEDTIENESDGSFDVFVMDTKPIPSNIENTNTSFNISNSNCTELKTRFKLKEVSVKIDRIRIDNPTHTPVSANPKYKNNKIQHISLNLQSEEKTKPRLPSRGITRSRLVHNDNDKFKLKNKGKRSRKCLETTLFPCTYTDCTKSYGSDAQLEEHIKRFHEGLKFPFPCAKCNKFCYSYEKLRQHQNVHLGLTPYQCPDPLCLKKFPTRFMLTCHTRRKELVKQNRITAKGVKIRNQNIPTVTVKRRNIKKPTTPFQFQCTEPACTKQYRTKFALEGHIKIVHEKSLQFPFPCDICKKPWYSYEKLRQHGNVHKGLTPYNCPDSDCDEKFATETMLYSHCRQKKRRQEGKRKNKPEPVPVPVSQLPTKQKSEENNTDSDCESIRDVSSEAKIIPRKRRRGLPPTFCCTAPNCPRKFSCESSLRHHIRQTHELNLTYPFNCDQCSKPCYSFKKLLQHHNVHKGLFPFVCPEAGCSKKYSTEDTLRVHRRQKHDPPRFQCEFCGKAFKVRTYYKMHVKIHENEGENSSTSNSHPSDDTFKCAHCGKTYGSVYTYKTHLATHDQSKIESLFCKVCDRVFSSKNYLKIHEQRVHTGEFAFKCSVCDFGGVDKGVLQQHMITAHSDARPHECHVCKHTFKTIYYLNRHKRLVHPVSKNHICDVCGKGFANRRYLQEHEETHKEVKSFLCSLCARYFTQRTRLNMHMKCVHGVSQSSKRVKVAPKPTIKMSPESHLKPTESEVTSTESNTNYETTSEEDPGGGFF